MKGLQWSSSPPPPPPRHGDSLVQQEGKTRPCSRSSPEEQVAVQVDLTVAGPPRPGSLGGGGGAQLQKYFRQRTFPPSQSTVQPTEIVHGLK